MAGIASAVGIAFLESLRALGYRAWQDRRGNTDYDVTAVDAGEYREWFATVLANGAAEGDAPFDAEGVCLGAWRYSNHQWGELDDAGFVTWWATHHWMAWNRDTAAEYNYTNAPIGHREVLEVCGIHTPNAYLRCSCGLLLGDRRQLAEHHEQVRQRARAAVGVPDVQSRPNACAIVENGGPYQITDECVHVSAKEWNRIVAGHKTVRQVPTAASERPRLALNCAMSVYVRCPLCGAAQPRAARRDHVAQQFLWSRDELLAASKENEGRVTCINDACGATIILDADEKVTFEW